MTNLVFRAGQECSVHLGRDSLDRLPTLLPDDCHTVALVADSQVDSYHGDRVAALLSERVQVERFWFPAGEASKTRAGKEELEDKFLARNLDRDCLVIALGGGVTTDLAGFVAGTYRRGLAWIAVPSSLLAMVDASLGGKVGVDTPAGKNMIGMFHSPQVVCIDIDLLTTLPPAELDHGLAEMIKHAVIADPSYLDALLRGAEKIRALDPTVLQDLIWRSVEIKTDIVAQDPREQNLRQVLNLGHTIGHAIEIASGYAVGHGRAVAAGLSVEASIACMAGFLPESERDRIRAALSQLALPLAPPAELSAPVIFEASRADKKGKRAEPRFVLAQAIGQMAKGPEGFGHQVDQALVLAAIEETRSCSV